MQKFLLIEGSSCVRQSDAFLWFKATFPMVHRRIAVLALKEYPYIEKLFLVGDAVATGNELKRLDFKDARIEIFHASEVVSIKARRASPVIRGDGS